jgi:myo-inositol-1(or 4)-monophosphatase
MDSCRSSRYACHRCALCLRLVCGAFNPLWPAPPYLGALLVKKKDSLSNITLIAIEAALLAGEVLRKGFGTEFSISSKEGIHNLVTEYDHLSEKTILDFLKQNVPESSFLAEESGKTGSAAKEWLWIVDPLDGTVNYAHRIPIFSVSIAAEKKGEIFCGVVFQPITHELFVAEKGKGAFLNGNPIRVSGVSALEKSMIATGFPYNLADNPFHCIDHFVDILRLGIPIRRLGSAAIDLAYTASGRFEGFFEVELGAWDCAAGKLLVEEAGGKVTTWENHPFEIRSRRSILASNGRIHDSISTILKRKV